MAATVVGIAGVANPVAAASSARRREQRNLSLSRSAVVGGSSGSQLRSRSLKTPGGRARQSRNGSQVHCISISKETPPTTTALPLREIPGDYGLPFFGAIKDKLDYYWVEGHPKYYESRRDKYNSTVYRMNTVPGPPFFPDPRVIVLLDEKSFPTLFDMDKVDKKDVFTGTYRPHVNFNGGYRILPYLDTSEPMHAKLKSFCFEVLKGSAKRVFPEMHTCLADVFAAWETGLKKDGKISTNKDLPLATFRFNVKAFLNVDPASPSVQNSLGTGATGIVQKWIVPQIIPIAVIPGVPKLLIPLVELLLHTFPIPFLLVKKQYNQICDFFRSHSGPLLDIAEQKCGVSKDEALHNLVFYTCFNSWGGLNFLFPSILKRIGSASSEFQRELSGEVRRAIKLHGGLNPAALADMPLVQSAVYEVLRVEPPVPFQYGRAKKDLIIESHDAAFKVKKGEMLTGYLPTVCQDPKVFVDPKVFNPKRFMGDEGRKLLQYVLWSNGPQTESPTLENKHCAGKDFILMCSQLFVAEIYSKYETLEVDGVSGDLSKLKKASYL